MVFREDPDGLILIAQPAHSWISGQLARHWGNEMFGHFAPFEEVCLAAEQHDIGFLSWEKAPTLNPKTGRPHDFMSMPTPLHLELWSASVLMLETYSRYAALLVSLHLSRLCQRNKVDKSPRAAQAAQGFLDQQHAIRHELLAGLRTDSQYASLCTPDQIDRNHRLLAAWDWMSLVLCRGVPGEHTATNVPVKDGAADVMVHTSVGCPTPVSLTPWPFSNSEVWLICEGRRLPETFTDRNEMRAALREAPTVAVTVCLKPA